MTLGPHLSDPVGQTARMNDHTNEVKYSAGTTAGGETLWQTLAGCAVFWAGLLALWCML